MKTLRHAPLAGLLLTLAAASPAGAADDPIVRHRTSDWPIASSVVVPPGTTLVYLSGVLADAAKPDAPAGSIERFGDTQTQAASILGKLSRELAVSGLTLGDVVKMNVFLVGDPAQGGAMDFAGLLKAFARVFGAGTQGRLPARTTVQVSALAVPGALVEIEAVAARP